MDNTESYETVEVDDDDHTEPEDEHPENTEPYDPTDPGEDDDDHTEPEDDPDKGKSDSYPNVPVGGTRIPAQWTFSGILFSDGTAESAQPVGLTAWVNREENRIMEVTRCYVVKGPDVPFDPAIAVFYITDDYPGDHPKVIRANGSACAYPEETPEARKPDEPQDPENDNDDSP